MNKPFYGAASITCSSRSQIINHECSLGPGSNNTNIEKTCNSLPKWTLKPRLEHGSCFKQTKENRPPPGSYEVSGNMKRNVTLKNPNYRSDKYKQTNQKVNHVSTLNLPSSISLKKGSSFGYRDDNGFCQVGVDSSPGPIYNPTQNIEQTRSNKIKNTCRGFGFGEKNTIYKHKNDAPGPGAYYEEDESSNKIQRISPNSTFGRSPRSIVSKTSPLGPGEYQINLNTNSQKAFRFKGKLPQAAKYVNPNGPGTYELPDTKSCVGPRFNHHRHKSSTFEQKQGPNPFTYDCKRYPENNVDSKACSLGKKIHQSCNSSSRNPGPGTYETCQELAQPHVGGYMGRKVVKKKPLNKDDCFGKYDPKMNYTIKEGCKYAFSQEAKPWNKISRDEKIGPCHYTVAQKVGGQSYSMGKSQRFGQLKKSGGYAYRQKQDMHSTIGYMPSYLKKTKKSMDSDS